MHKQVNYSFQFPPASRYAAYVPQVHYNARYIPPEKSVKERITYYFLRALHIIQSALQLLKSSTPFFEKYNPMLKQLPNMYKMIRLIQAVNDETEERSNKDTQLRTKQASQVSTPTLFI